MLQQIGRASHRIMEPVVPGAEGAHAVEIAAGGDTLATHGRGGAMRGRRQNPIDILQTRPQSGAVKQGM